ncbi:hypothetical protein QM787_02775 [Rhodococcus ruber]|uniref:hypothetical protein n=1 Tax=Rhodococcus TaxID=1827 RepID=UPI000299F9A4|nr:MULTISPECIES: hypothetical protein [Rhodococcus]ATQ31202.1 hypothetical protein CS378_22320 [Rhodococcus ruber]MCD2126810.1 hypothetical protein [Rhodococcus ruber]MCZ4503689.1 hypothetical protein [Rhodococcus ruber]MCZ4532197.1 hypothetical protein [Rhodococcus ruber]MCZ4619232.1 hypothetical protein [Rhodococcus ruber]
MHDDSTAPTDGTPLRGRSEPADESPGPKRAGTFVYPLPGTLTGNGASAPHAVGSHAADHDVADEAGGNGSDPLSLPSFDEIVAGTNGVAADSTPTAASRRNSMGVASVRIAARLAHTELAARAQRSGAGGPDADPTLGTDELLTLLGEYLVAGGFENPQIRATLGGQEIVVDLLAPRRTTL